VTDEAHTNKQKSNYPDEPAAIGMVEERMAEMGCLDCDRGRAMGEEGCRGANPGWPGGMQVIEAKRVIC